MYSNQNYLMDQETQFFQSTTTIRDQLASSPYVRHYMQEEAFSFTQKLRVEIPFNHLINQIVSQLNILNKLISSNSKLTSSLLENGKDIFIKKKPFFDDFCLEYGIIGDALAHLTQDARLVFEYSVMSLSNLILKLSLNMAKISIVVVSRYLTPSYLNIFTVSILFEKYLEFHLVRTRRHSSPQDHRHFLKQFPRMTVIKISKYRNPYDLEFVNRINADFNTTPFPQKSTSQKEIRDVCNLQLIQFFQTQDDNGMMTKKIERRSPRNMQFNLKETFELSTPFGFQLFLLTSEIVIPKMVDFKPDVIIYIEDFEGEASAVDPQVRGLIVNQLSEKVQQKIYIFREFGITEAMKNDWLKQHKEENFTEFTQDFSDKMSEQLKTAAQYTFISESDSKLREWRRKAMKANIKQNMKITDDISKKLTQHLKTSYRKGSAYSKDKQIDQQFEAKLKSLHQATLEDLTYLSLALIQKSNFEEVIRNYRNHIFSPQFLSFTIKYLQRQFRAVENEHTLTELGEGLKNKIEKIRGMMQFSVRSGIAQLNYTKIKTFFNFFSGKQEELKYVYFREKQPRLLPIANDDSFYFAYVGQYIILFLFTDTQFSIYRKRSHEEIFTCIREEKFTLRNIGLSKKYSTYVSNQRYFYKAFGEAKDPQLNEESEIYRIQIEKPETLQSKDFEKFATTCFVQHPDRKQKPAIIPLEFKRHGFGYSYDLAEGERRVNFTIFGGGYNFKIQNQQKINRFFYVIRDNSNDVFKIGKTNGQIVNQTQNMRNKHLIYPFVYGIPLWASHDEFLVFNSNGYLENINNFKKIFLTRVKSGPVVNLSSIGIIGQNKLDYQNQSPQIAVANKNTILASFISCYHRINRMGNRAALYNGDGDVLMMEWSKATEAHKYDMIRVYPLNSKEMSECEDTLNLYFSSRKMIMK